MRQRLSFLVFFAILSLAHSAFGSGLDAKIDTVFYSNIQNFLFSPIQMSDYNFLGTGARARGMGGAFFAVSNDPTAASWNPAGLSLMDKAQMDLSFSSYMDQGERTTSGLNFNLSDTQKPEYTKNRVSSAGVVIPFKLGEKEVVGSVLYQVLSDIYQENSYTLINDSLRTNQGFYVKNQQDVLREKVTGSLDVINLALGAKVYGSFSLGLGVNVYFGGFTNNVDLDYSRSGVFGADIDARIDTFISGADTTMDTTVTAVNTYLNYHPTIESEYSGFNFTVGGLYQIDKLNLAAVVRTPFTLKEKNDFQFLADEWERGIVSKSGILSTTTEGEADREWKIPFMAGFGASYQVSSLTLAADVEQRNYSKSEVTYHQKVLDPLSNKMTEDLGWRNLTQFRIGGEYVFHTGPVDIPIRAGFRNDPQLFTDQYDSLDVFLEEYLYYIAGLDTLWPQYIKSKPGADVGSWVNGNVFSLGTGISWRQIKFDVTFEFANYDDVQRKVFTEIVAYDPAENRIERITFGPKEFSQKISTKYNRIMVSFTGFF